MITVVSLYFHIQYTINMLGENIVSWWQTTIS